MRQYDMRYYLAGKVSLYMFDQLLITDWLVSRKRHTFKLLFERPLISSVTSGWTQARS